MFFATGIENTVPVVGEGSVKVRYGGKNRVPPSGGCAAVYGGDENSHGDAAEIAGVFRPRRIHHCFGGSFGWTGLMADEGGCL